MKKKIYSTVCLLCLLLTKTSLAEIGEIKALTAPDAAPFDFTDEYSKVMGFDIDLIQAIAKDQGFTITFTTDSIPNILKRIKTDGDIVLLPLNATESRKKDMDFSDSYVTAPTAIAYTDKNLKIRNISDLKDKKVVVLTDYPFIEKIRAQYPASIEEVDTNFLMYRAIWNGQAQAAVGDQRFFQNILKNRPKHKFRIVSVPAFDGTDDGYWGIKKGNEELRKAVNDGLINLKINGEYQKIYQKWFGQ